ncbi:MAG: UvrB/UvrC motif-containing protein [Planctomycetota bacterium]
MLREWPYEPGKLNVRLIKGEDGEPKIQVRLDLGLLQMNAEGRPDGERPFGFDSLLEHFEHQADEHVEDDNAAAGDGTPENHAGGEDAEVGSTGDADGDADGDDADAFEDRDRPPGAFRLAPEECKALRDEAAQYYHRYVALLVLEDFEGVIRDTTRNLRLLDFCRSFADEDNDRTILEQVRPYITMMRARAMASQAIKDNEPKVALMAVDDGLRALQDHYTEMGDASDYESSNEVQMLRSIRETLIPRLPVSQKAELRTRLDQAIAQENYELAAILRDELRLLPDESRALTPPPPPPPSPGGDAPSAGGGPGTPG